jgi:hypothetical protein
MPIPQRFWKRKIPHHFNGINCVALIVFHVYEESENKKMKTRTCYNCEKYETLIADKYYCSTPHQKRPV